MPSLRRCWCRRSEASEANFPHGTAEALAFYGCNSDTGAKAGVAEAFADTQFNYGARLLLRAMTAQGQCCWRYRFTRRRPGQADGPHHGDEVGHVFSNLAAGRGRAAEPFDNTDLALSNAMMQAWVAFARDGHPGTPAGIEWPVFELQQDGPLEFGDSGRIGDDPRRAQLDLLDRCFATN